MGRYLYAAIAFRYWPSYSYRRLENVYSTRLENYAIGASLYAARASLVIIIIIDVDTRAPPGGHQGRHLHTPHYSVERGSVGGQHAVILRADFEDICVGLRTNSRELCTLSLPDHSIVFARLRQQYTRTGESRWDASRMPTFLVCCMHCDEVWRNYRSTFGVHNTELPNFIRLNSYHKSQLTQTITRDAHIPLQCDKLATVVGLLLTTFVTVDRRGPFRNFLKSRVYREKFQTEV